METLFIGVLKEEEEEKEKDNQYKLKKAMANIYSKLCVKQPSSK